MYVFISQYVLIESGASRTEILLSLSELSAMFKGPAQIAANEVKIRQLLESANLAGVTPDYLTHGSKIIRSIVQRGQAYSDALQEQGIRKGGAWAVEPKSRDVTKMVLDLIQIVKQVDTEEQMFEVDDQDAVRKKDKSAVHALNAEAKKEADKTWEPTSAIAKKLKSACADEALKISKAQQVQINAVLVAAEPSINLDRNGKGFNKHDKKLVAGKILLTDGQELTMSKLVSGAKLVKGYSSHDADKKDQDGQSNKRKRGQENGEDRVCEADRCRTRTGEHWKKYCEFHFNSLKDGRSVWRKDGTTDTYSSNRRSQGSKGGDKGGRRGGPKGSSRGNGKGKGKARVAAQDASGNIQTFQLDTQTMDALAKMKDGGLTCLTESEAKAQKKRSYQSLAQGLIGN